MARTDAKIILTSAWKEAYFCGWDEEWDYLKRELAAVGLRVAGMTRDGGAKERGAGIVRFMRGTAAPATAATNAATAAECDHQGALGDTVRFVILDYDVYDFKAAGVRDRLYRVNPCFGLRESDVSKIEEMLE